MKFKNIIISIFLILAFALPGWGATYYVSQDGTGAKDGSLAAPSAIATFNAGTAPYDNLDDDTVYFLDTLTTYILPYVGGSSGHIATLRGDYPGHPCVVSLSSADNGHLKINTKSYITATGFTFTYTGTSTSSIAVYLLGTASYITLDNLTINKGGYGSAIYDSGTRDHLTISNTSITGVNAASRYAINLTGTGCTNLTLSNLTIPQMSDGISISNLTGGTISNIIGTWNRASSTGFQINNSSTVVVSNVTLTGSTGAYGSVILLGSTTATTLTDVTNDHGAGFYIKNTANNLTLTRCRALSSLGYAFHFYDSVNTIAVNNCYASISGDDGFGVEGTAHDITFKWCEAYLCGIKTALSNGEGFTSDSSGANIFFEYCIAHKNTTAGFGGAGGSQGHVYNCIAYKNGGDWFTQLGGLNLNSNYGGFVYLANNNGTKWVIKNCISSQNYPREFAYPNNAAELIAGDIVLSNNCWNPLNAANFATVANANKSYTEWVALGYDTYSMNADPKFKSTADFHLLPDSLAKDRGTNLGAGFNLDYDGKNQNLYGAPDPASPGNMKWEIGAYAFPSSSVIFRHGGKFRVYSQ